MSDEYMAGLSVPFPACLLLPFRSDRACLPAAWLGSASCTVAAA